MAVWEYPARLWTVVRKVEDLLELQHKTRENVDRIEARLRALEDRMTRLEANQTQIISEARAAAAAAATSLAGSIISDVVTRVTRLELRHDEPYRRLSPPS